MLQRAASSAYSWWWASHIRTKQSKWMEQNLLDMEEKVQNALKLIEEDGDSFARRAEMYYKKRPELIFFVEESYRAYRALAERYDHISTELQNANNTIASVFPEQVEFAMDEEDEEAMPKFSKKGPQINRANIPKVPKAPVDLKTVITTATKKLKPKKISNLAAAASAVAKSGLGKRQALDEIDKLQKNILSLQTEKEFLKSSYESQLGRYWEIENQIKEMQDRVFNLQDEYGEGIAIEDDEARNLMANAALKSCQESLAQLQEKQERSAEEARTESARIKEVRKRLDSLKGELHGDRSNEEKQNPVVPDQLNEEVNSRIEEKQKAEQLRQKIKQQLEASTCLTMTDMAENIDELVNKVISLETAFSSQTALINQLRSETNKLQTEIRALEHDKASIIDGKNNLQQKLKEMEKKLSALQNLNQKLENEKSNFQSQIIEAHCNLDHLSGKLPSIQQDEDPEPGSSRSMVQLEQPEKLKADEEPKPKSSVSMVQVQQTGELPGVKLGASGADTELTQPDEKLRAEEGCDNPKQRESDEVPIIEMKTSPKEEESQNLEGKSEEADASSMNRNQKNICPVQMDSPNSGSSSKKLGVSTTSRSLKVVDTRDNSKSSKGSGEVIAQTLSVSTEDNPKKNDADGSATNLIEVVETKANSQHTEGGHEEGRVNSTDRSRVEEVQFQDESQSSKGSCEEYNADAAVKSEEVIAHSLSGSATKLVEAVETKANSQHSEADREEARVNTTSRNQVKEVQIQDESQSAKGSHEESDAGNTAKGPEGIVVDLSVNTEGNPEKNDDNGSAGNRREVIETKANSQYSEGDTNLGHPSGKNKEEKKKKMMMKKVMKKNCSGAFGAEDEEEQRVVNEVDEPNWQQLFLSGIEDREKALLAEYTITLRNFRDAKKKLIEMDEKNRDHLQTLKQLNELKTVNALKDQEIRSLHHKLNLMQKCFNENRESMDLSSQKIDFSASSDDQKTSKDQNVEAKITMNGKAGRRKRLTRQEVSNDSLGFDISELLIQQPETTTSEIEERLRMRIDELLEENLDFWLKFSATFHQIQQFETGIQDLKTEVTKLQEKGKKQDVSGSGNFSLRSEARPLYKHLREIQNELNIWSDKSGELKEELEDRFSSLCNIQEEITAGLKASAEDDDFSFTSYQAAKFQGEVLNMKQENNKVADELQAALDHIGSLQYEVETNLAKLNEEFRLSGLKQETTPQLTHSESRNRVPLRSFIFGVKPKKQKQSIFSGMAPVMQKKYYALKAGNL